MCRGPHGRGSSNRRYCRHDSATLRIVARVLVFASLVLALGGCAGKDASYTTEEVIKAFQRHGITLTVGERTETGDILAPRDLSFVVLVATVEAADEEWDAYLDQSDPRSLDAREKNVLVASDNGDTDLRLRRRIRAALASLSGD
jgi:type IV pilus biogenesis protein CpaD/CtpE